MDLAMAQESGDIDALHNSECDSFALAPVYAV